MFYFSQSTHSLLETGDLIFDGFHVLPTADCYPLQILEGHSDKVESENSVSNRIGTT
jgi:hypothetical protein